MLAKALKRRMRLRTTALYNHQYLAGVYNRVNEVDWIREIEDST